VNELPEAFASISKPRSEVKEAAKAFASIPEPISEVNELAKPLVSSFYPRLRVKKVEGETCNNTRVRPLVARERSKPTRTCDQAH